ncbi:MAG: TIGR03862 family flavoprotein [Bacteroidota bacterium]
MKKSVAIFGSGPASLAFASFLNPIAFDVTIYEKNKACGRKFLVAGKGGFNLTFSEPMDQFKKRYIPNAFLEGPLDHFSNTDFQDWLKTIGIETFVGSSKRVFPIKGIKPIQVLDAILGHIRSNGVEVHYNQEWTGWSNTGLPLINDEIEIHADYYVYALGGASWKITGSTGDWAEKFRSRNIAVNTFLPSNCAFEVEWPDHFLDYAEGMPLKNIALSCGGKIQKGELVITRFGLEGNAIYALSHSIREELGANGKAYVSIDFKPMFTMDEIEHRLRNTRSKNHTEFLRRDVKLRKIAIQMLKNLLPKEKFTDESSLIESIKGFPIWVVGSAPIDEAISTAGGVSREELTPQFELKKMKNHFCVGEMVDWDTRTGGYLLQGCFRMGVFLASWFNGIIYK